MSDFAQKNKRFTHSLIFSERPEWFALDRSFPLNDLSESLMVTNFGWATWAICSHPWFLVSNLSDSLISLTKKEGRSESLIFKIKTPIQTYQKKFFDFFSQNFWVNRSFIISHLSKSLLVAHLSWATWAICSWSLICLDRPERFAHRCSFVLSNLSESLLVAHLSWGEIWAKRSQSLIWFERNEHMSDWAMSIWANSQPWILVSHVAYESCICICMYIVHNVLHFKLGNYLDSTQYLTSFVL